MVPEAASLLGTAIGGIIGAPVGAPVSAVLGLVTTLICSRVEDPRARLRFTSTVVMAIGIVGAILASLLLAFNRLHPDRAVIYVGLSIAGGCGGILLMLWANRLLVNYLYRSQPDRQVPRSWMAPSSRFVGVAFAFATVVTTAIAWVRFT